MRRLLVLRPEPGASATAARAAALGLEAVVAPLFVARAVAWDLPANVGAVAMTSANAARLGGAMLRALTDRPLYAVGEATAAAARDAGFSDVRVAGGDAAALGRLIDADQAGPVLHLAGREHHPIPTAQPVETRIVYAVEAAASLTADPVGTVALLHSPRAAAVFVGLVTDRARVRIAAISPAAAEAAGEGWQAVRVADRPTDDALLAVAAELCED